MADTGRNGQNGRQSDSNLSSAFESFSRSLDNHTRALDRFMDDFERVSSRITRDLGSVNGRTSGSRSSERDSESALRDIHRELERSGRAVDRGMTTLQKTGRSLETIIMNVGSLVISEIKSATRSVSNSYKSHLSSITAQMQISNKEYAQLFNEASEYFRQSGLNKQFSPVDYAEALESVLSEGLRGDSARQLAYQNLVMNKLVPAISTNTVAYRRMSKVFGEEFNKNTLAFAKYTESVLGAEGISEGKFDSMLSTLESQIMYASRGDSEVANKTINELTAALSWLESNNLDADAFVNDLYSAATGQIGDASVMQFIWGAGTPEDVIRAMVSDSGIPDLIERYVKAYSQNAGYGANSVGSYANAVGGNVDQAYRASAYILSGGSLGNISEEIQSIVNGYSQESVYDKVIEDLKDGWTQTADDALTKQEENLMTWTATATSSIARFDEALNAVTETLKSLASIWLFTSTLESAGRLSSGAGLSGRVSSFGGASSLGRGLTNLALGPGALVVGGSMMLGDGVSTGLENRSVGAGLLSSVTGDSNIGLSYEEKMTKAVETVQKGWVDSFGIDWKKVGGNALKGTALGAGVGTAVGGWAAGAGTAIGAGVGAVTGAVASIIDQTIESAKYNKLAKASSELEDSMSSLKSAQSDYRTTVSKNSETMEVLNNWNQLDADQKSEMFSYLQDQYPSILGNLSSESDLDSQYIEILKQKIEYENALASKRSLDSASEVFDDLKSERDSLTNALDGYRSQASRDFVNSVISTGGENGVVWSSREIDDTLTEIAQKYGMSKSDLIQELNSGKSGQIIKSQYNKSGDFVGYTLTGQNNDAGRGGYTAGDNFKQFIEDYSGSESQQKKAKDYIDSQISAMLEAYQTIDEIYLQYYDSATKKIVEGFGKGSTSETKVSLDKTMKAFEEAIMDIKSVGSTYGLEGVVTNRLNNAFPDISTVWSAFGRSVPKFKLGLNTVPYDDYLASLHAGEMVLNAENANQMRDIASRGSGLTGVLSAVEGLSRAKLVATESSQSLSSNKIVEAIGEQTSSIVGVLNSILDVLSRMSASQRITGTAIPRSTITFEGV